MTLKKIKNLYFIIIIHLFIFCKTVHNYSITGIQFTYSFELFNRFYVMNERERDIFAKLVVIDFIYFILVESTILYLK